MSDSDETIEWRQLREFAAVDLTRSFVLSWHIESGTLIIDIDLYLMPRTSVLREAAAGRKGLYSPGIHRVSIL